MAFDINGKVALITGANRGIGKAITETLLANGAAKVYAAVRNPESAQPLVDTFGDRVVPIEFDLTKPKTVRKAAKLASDVSLVVNNGGVLTNTAVLDDNVFDNLQYELDVNLFGLIHTAQAFAPVLKANGGGALAQLNSGASMKTFPGFATYSASKAAAYAITQGLYWTLKEQGTEVYSVHPGPIATDMADQAGMNEIAEPASQVGEALIDAMRKGEFHVWTDTLSRHVGDEYKGFATNIVLSDMSDAPA